MTVSSQTSRVSYSGNGSTTAFAVSFYFLENTHLKVILRAADGTETVKALTTDYTVAGAGNLAGGTVTMNVAPATGTTLVIVRNVPLTQETDYQANDPFPAESHERALDKLTMEVQQQQLQIDRSIKVPATTPINVSTELPNPEMNKLIGWNESATGLQNIDGGTLATIVAYGTARSDVFTGDGVQTAFTLSYNPGSLNNLDVSIDGATQINGVDFNWTSGTTLTMTTAVPNGSKLLVRYMQGLPTGTADADDVQYARGGGAVARTVGAKLREFVSVKDFGAVGDGVTNDSAAIQAAIDYVANNGGGTVYAPANSTGYVAYGLVLKPLVRLVGGGGIARIETALAAQYNLKQTTFLVPAGETGISVAVNTGHCSLENIRVQGVAGGGIGIDCQTYNFKTTNVGVNGFLDGIGVILAENYRASHENLDIQLCGLGLYLKDDCNAVSFVNLIIENCSVGLYSDGTNRGTSYHACTIESCKKGIGGTSFPSAALLTVIAQTLTDVGFATQADMEGGAYLQGFHAFQSLYMEDNGSVNIYISAGSVDIVGSYLNDWLVGTAKPVYTIDGRRAESVSLRNSWLSTENGRATALLRFNQSNFNICLGNQIFDAVLGTPYTGTLYYDTGGNLNGLLQRAPTGGRMDNLQIRDLYITGSGVNAVIQTTDSNRDIIIDPHGTGKVQTTKRIVASAAAGANSVVRANNTTASGDVYGFESYLLSNANTTSSYHFRGSTDNVGAWYLYGNGTTSFTSDVRRKKNIETTRNGYLEDFDRLRVVKYNWNTQKDEDPKELGLIAQEVEQVFPGLIQDEPEPASDGITYKVIKGSVLVPMLIKCVQELHEKVKVLEQELNSRS